MGCAASRLDNEDVVRRCKERRRFMKDAVFARHHLAGAHADYCRSLRLTGSALSAFADNEPLSVSDQTPAVFLHRPSPSPGPGSGSIPSFNHVPPRVPSPAPSSIHPPPPPPPLSPSIASSKLHRSISSSSSANHLPRVQTRHNQRQKPMKLPHILSESSPNSSPGSLKSDFTSGYPAAYATNTNYATTPSQASSVWNWDNFYPPSPPDSEFFDQRAHSKDNLRQPQDAPTFKHRHEEDEDEAFEEDASASDYDFFQKKEFHESVHGEAEREEVQCSDWGDHYSTTSSSSHEEDDVHSRSDIGSRSNFGSVRNSMPNSTQQQQRPQPAPSNFTKSDDISEHGAASSTMSYGDMRIVLRHKDLKEIVDSLKENFELAAAAGDQVSEMLELGRAQLDRSFKQLKKTVYHSSSVLSTLSSTWSSKPPLAVKYRIDAGSISDPAGGSKSLCSTLDRLLAWEKKLYEDVKAREGVKIEHDKKLGNLQSQEYKGDDEVKLDKTKASIKRLHSLIIVTSQAVSTTSTAIIGLRDSDLVPQLVELCHGFMYMWRSMYEYHEVQNNIVQQVRGLVNQVTKGESTSELHRQATRDLELAVSGWHSSFCRLIKFQREFIRSLHGWFKLTLLPVENTNNDNNNSSRAHERSNAYSFCDAWKLALDQVPDTVASEAIKSFINVVHVISAKQAEELKIKKRTETAAKELEKKASSLRNIERKYYQSYSMVGIGLPDENGQGLDARDPLSEKKSELAACQRRVSDEMVRHSKAVEVTRAMTLNNLQTGLPGVFQAMTSFSSMFRESLETVCTRSYNI